MLADFDAYCEANNITPDEAPTAFAAWLNLSTGWDGRQHRCACVCLDPGAYVPFIDATDCPVHGGRDQSGGD